MGYTKLFSELITSTIWAESDETRIVWITMLALKDKWGVVNATMPGLAHLARVPLPVCEQAVGKFLAPDKYSRTADFEGRRIEVCEGGWRVLNHEKYRRLMSADERRDYLAAKQREHRARQQSVNNRQQMSTPSTHSDADADAPKHPKPSAGLTNEELIYALYPRKQGKKAALQAIKRALSVKPKDAILEATKAFSDAVGAWPAADRQFIPHPATWFNRGSYDDDRKEWERKSNAAHQRPNDRSYSTVDDYSRLPGNP